MRLNYLTEDVLVTLAKFLEPECPKTLWAGACLGWWIHFVSAWRRIFLKKGASRNPVSSTKYPGTCARPLPSVLSYFQPIGTPWAQYDLGSGRTIRTPPDVFECSCVLCAHRFRNSRQILES